MNKNKCEKCTKSFYLKNEKCVENCGKGYVENNGQCFKCSRDCKKCKRENPKECIYCIKRMILFNGECVNKCPLRYYLNDENYCESIF